MGKIVAACVVLVIVFAAMLASRSQALQRFAVLELVLALAVSGSAYLGLKQSKDFAQQQYLDMYGLYAGRLAGYLEQVQDRGTEAFDSESLDALLVQTLPVTTVDGKSFSYLGAVLLTQQKSGDYRQAFSAGDHRSMWDLYRGQGQALIRQSLEAQRVCAQVTKDGTGLLAVTDTTRIAPKTALVVEISLAPIEGELQELYENALHGGVLLFFSGTLLLALIIYLQGREIRKAVRIITRVAQGKAQWESMGARRGFFGESIEMRGLRTSLAQLVSDNHRSNYMKYRMFQAYYRFAPKQIEKLLGKPSILDVDMNDHIQMKGILAFVLVSLGESIEGRKVPGRLGEYYGSIQDAGRGKDGIFLGGNTDLSGLNFLFPDDAKQALQFGIDAVMRREDMRAEGRTFVLLHHTSLMYGVAGDEKQASTYVLSKEMKVLEHYTDKLRGMGVRMAVTEGVFELIGREAPARYIGFIEKGSYRFKIYEILDAYPAKERQQRLDTMQKFEDAMKLFYQDDFYLARNLFTEVLKENPTDEVAKWYLFLCENCLNSTGAEEISYGLFAES